MPSPLIGDSAESRCDCRQFLVISLRNCPVVTNDEVGFDCRDLFLWQSFEICLIDYLDAIELLFTPRRILVYSMLHNSCWFNSKFQQVINGRPHCNHILRIDRIRIRTAGVLNGHVLCNFGGCCRFIG